MLVQELSGMQILDQALGVVDERLAVAEEDRIIKYLQLAISLRDRHHVLTQDKTRLWQERVLLRSHIRELQLVYGAQFSAERTSTRERVSAIASRVQLLISELEQFKNTERVTAQWLSKVNQNDQNPLLTYFSNRSGTFAE